MQPNASICSWLSPSVLSTLSLNNELENAGSIAGFERNWWSDWHEYHLESFYCSVDHRRQRHNRRCMWQKLGGGSEARKPKSLKIGGLKPISLTEVYAYVNDTQGHQRQPNLIGHISLPVSSTRLRHINTSLAYVTVRDLESSFNSITLKTRNSAVTERPRDAPCRWSWVWLV